MRVHLKKSPRYDKKFRVTFENDKIVDFGARQQEGVATTTIKIDEEALAERERTRSQMFNAEPLSMVSSSRLERRSTIGK